MAPAVAERCRLCLGCPLASPRHAHILADECLTHLWGRGAAWINLQTLQFFLGKGCTYYAWPPPSQCRCASCRQSQGNSHARARRAEVLQKAPAFIYAFAECEHIWDLVWLELTTYKPSAYVLLLES